MAQGRVLVVEADQGVSRPIRTALREEGYAVQFVGSADRALAEVGEQAYDLVLLSLPLPDTDALALVTGLTARRPDLVVVALVPADRRAEGLAARAAGAFTFLETPRDLSREKILATAASAVEHRRVLLELAAARTAGATLNLEERERQAILAALDAAKWNKQAAARLLGLHRPTLYAKMRKHGIPQKRLG